MSYESLLYSYYDWDVVAKGKGSGYCFEIEKDSHQVMFYFGANHSRDKNDPQYEKTRSYWQKFLGKTGGKNSIVLVEGGERLIHESEELAIKRDSEPGFMTLLANKAGIPTYSPEPNQVEMRNYLLSKFSADKSPLPQINKSPHRLLEQMGTNHDEDDHNSLNRRKIERLKRIR